MNRFLTFKWTRILVAAAVMILVSVTSLFAQQRVTVSGVVLDENNLPMIGVGVMQKGTSNGVATDLDGKYTISVPAGSTIVFRGGTFGVNSTSVDENNQAATGFSIEASRTDNATIHPLSSNTVSSSGSGT